jgi:GT2 family glycosyltransferase
MTAFLAASPPLVYVITLTWNQQEDTLSCLESLTQMTYPHYRILLVDNGSADRTSEVVAERFPTVELIINDQNLGFQGGFNVGIRHALTQGAAYVFIINNDTLVDPNILTELMAQATQPGVGIVGPKIYYADAPNCIWSVGGQRHPWTLEMTGTGRGQLDKGQWEQVLERDYLVGCALLLERSMLETVGLFDTGFHPIYYEDLDLCLRARRAGFRLLLVPQAHMWHKVSASAGGNSSPRVRYLMARNSLRFFRKHARGRQWAAIIPFRTGSAIKTTFRLLLQCNFDSLAAYWQGLSDGMRQTSETQNDLAATPHA